jgi:hypothetical protein
LGLPIQSPGGHNKERYEQKEKNSGSKKPWNDHGAKPGAIRHSVDAGSAGL